MKFATAGHVAGLQAVSDSDARRRRDGSAAEAADVAAGVVLVLHLGVLPRRAGGDGQLDGLVPGVNDKDGRRQQQQHAHGALGWTHTAAGDLPPLVRLLGRLRSAHASRNRSARAQDFVAARVGTPGRRSFPGAGAISARFVIILSSFRHHFAIISPSFA